MTELVSKLPELIDASTARAILHLSSLWRTVILQRRGRAIRVDSYRGSKKARIRVYRGRAHRSKPEIDVTLEGWEFRGLLRARVFRSSTDIERRLRYSGFLHRVEEQPDKLVLVWEPFDERFRLQPIFRDLPVVPIVEKSSDTYTITLELPRTDAGIASSRPDPLAGSGVSFYPREGGVSPHSGVDFEDRILEAETDATLGLEGARRPPHNDAGFNLQDAGELGETDVTIRSTSPHQEARTDIGLRPREGARRPQSGVSFAGDLGYVRNQVGYRRNHQPSGAREFLEAFAVNNPWGQVLASRGKS